MKNNSKVHIIDHPLIQQKLSVLRDKKTNSKAFRENLTEITRLMAYEVLKDLQLKKVKISTPLAKCDGYVLSQKINLYPILRAGQGMVDGFVSMVPDIRIGHIGLYREKSTLKPIEYLFKHPDLTPTDLPYNILIDPMVATGGSANMAIDILKKYQTKNIKFVMLLASKQGLENVLKTHPDIEIYVAAIDPILNAKGYIEPGLGDAGDRIFGTK